MIISKLTMYGFKNHKDLVDFELGTLTEVSGANGAGKTTIGEAIAWALLGADLTGNERATTRLVNHECKDVYVEMHFTFRDEAHVLIRRRKAGTTSIFLDDKTVKQNDLITFYNNKELFLSIFNPNYFPGLAPKDAKSLLERELEEVSKADVLANLPNKVVETLNDTGFKNSNLYLENQRARLKEIIGEIEYWNGFKEGKEETIEIPDVKVFDDKELKALNKELDKIKKIETTQFHDTSKLLKQRDKLSDKLNNLRGELVSLSRSEADTADIYSLESAVSNLRSSYTDKLGYAKSLDNVVKCPKCETVIDLDESTKTEILDDLATLKKDGVVAAKKLREAEASNAKIIKAHDSKVEKETVKLEKEIAKLEKEIGLLDIGKLESENKADAKQQKDVMDEKIDVITLQILQLQSDEHEVIYHNSQRDDLIERKESIDKNIQEAKDNVKELMGEQKDCKLNIDYAKQFTSKRLDMQSEQISQHLNKVAIQLEKITKDGEVVADFKILYDEKEFAILSNSERIKAGLEVSNLLMNVSTLYAPIFIDNAESITDIPKLDTQMIEARVKDNAELKVEVIK